MQIAVQFMVQGKTALDVAQPQGHTDIAYLLMHTKASRAGVQSGSYS